jgi:hypothetical protein
MCSRGERLSAVLFGLGLLLLGAPQARAGVTIHYEGKLAHRDGTAELVETARRVARTNHWRFEISHQPHVTASRMIDGKPIMSNGPVDGIVIYPAEWCEPLRLEVDGDGIMSSYVKTQFAGAEVHVQIVKLLRQLEPLFSYLRVTDEGDYWCTGNVTRLRALLDAIDQVFRDTKAADPKALVRIRLSEGRIGDALSAHMAPLRSQVPPSSCRQTKGAPPR